MLRSILTASALLLSANFTSAAVAGLPHAEESVASSRSENPLKQATVQQVRVRQQQARKGLPLRPRQSVTPANCGTYVAGTLFYISTDSGTTNFYDAGQYQNYNVDNVGFTSDSSKWLKFGLDSQCQLFDNTGATYRAIDFNDAYLLRKTGSGSTTFTTDSVTCKIAVDSKITCYPTMFTQGNGFAAANGLVILVTSNTDYTPFTGTAILTT